MNAIGKPVWLDEEAEIIALLHAVLDRFDRLPGDVRRHHVVLPAERHLSSLASNDAQADNTWAQIRELQRLGLLTVRTARGNLYDAGWKSARVAFAPASETALRDWLGRERLEPAWDAWRRAVQARADDFPGGSAFLLKRRIAIAGRTAEEVVAALATLASQTGAATLRQLSATAFWGDSKVLDDRGDLLAALFPRLTVRERALVVATYLPARCSGVLFIENQDTYTAAVAGLPLQAQPLALIYAAGFRGSAARIRSRSGALLHYAGPGAAALQGSFERWWYEEGPAPGPAWFWGDLDFAGMQILQALRGRFAGTEAWRPGYAPMLQALRTLGGYRPQSSESSGQTDPGVTGCPYADEELLPAIREHGQMDQERLVLA